jgi:hypothetical protein
LTGVARVCNVQCIEIDVVGNLGREDRTMGIPPAEWFREHADAARRQMNEKPWAADSIKLIAEEWDEYADRAERFGTLDI